MRLRNVLTPEQESLGYYLVETEHFVELWHRGRCIKVFSSSGGKPAERGR